MRPLLLRSPWICIRTRLRRTQKTDPLLQAIGGARISYCFAKASWIIWPFVLEALVYTFIGGALGIIIATLIVAAATFIPLENEVMSFLGRPTFREVVMQRLSGSGGSA